MTAKRLIPLIPINTVLAAPTTSTASSGPGDVLDLSPGDLVRVRSAAEIFGTLDAQGNFDNLPFMPEMVQYCGRTLRVDKRADKTCDGRTVLRRMHNTVHLVDVRCDGSAHAGCQAQCLTYWKEAWLERVDTEAAPDAPDAVGTTGTTGPADLDAADRAFVEETLEPATLASSTEERTYRCQATEIPRAGAQLRAWMIDQYPRDVRNWGLMKIVRGMTIYVFNKYQDLSRRFLPAGLAFHGGSHYPFLDGLRATSQARSGDLDLQPGDLVRIKSKDEIIATLDAQNRNKGLSFDGEMLSYCGGVARIKTQVNRLIDERNGKVVNIKRDCYILDGVVCKADYNRFCTRSTYPYWRSVWLDKLS